MHAYVYVCACMRVYVHVYMCVYVCMYVCVYVYICINIHTRVGVHMHSCRRILFIFTVQLFCVETPLPVCYFSIGLRYGNNHMVVSVPQTNAKGSIPVRVSPQKSPGTRKVAGSILCTDQCPAIRAELPNQFPLTRRETRK